ncbi:hypothetical protein B0J11DRAFT_573000 [Dendryphion nanum]|uniref:Uncharacterized protein n=1 Tax=Dendryphion nanum TaxID=256645 RepID=A0A9P9D511_9PLEO|nr:hypothetical protein B0J11DRAFT_573000 [Dendryphion nanum]
MSRVLPQYVKRGLWVNLEDGPVMGKTITTDTKTGNVVIALLAVTTAFGTTHLWNLAAFAYHQSRTKIKSADGLYRQQQALLRTLPTPSSIISEYVKLWWAWRGTADKAFLRSTPQIFLGSLFTVATIVSGVFSSYIVSSFGVPVLVNSPNCEVFNLNSKYSKFPETTSRVGISEYTSEVQILGNSYAKACYQNEKFSQLPEGCGVFVQPKVAFDQLRVKCPFQNQICAKIDQPGVSFDSGLFDLNDVLGTNLPSDERIRFRRKTTCAVLDLEKHHSFLNHSIIPNRLRVTQPDESSPKMEAWNTITPIPDLASPDADFVLITIAKNMIIYMNPVEDAVFAAHQKILAPSMTGSNVTIYSSDFTFSAFQFCLKQKEAQDFCSNLTGLPGLGESEYPPNATALQIETMKHLMTVSAIWDIAFSSGNLQVAEIAKRGLVPSLPDDQWVKELAGWEAATWATFQIGVTDYSTGVKNRVQSVEDNVHLNLTVGQKQLCGMQRMRNPGGFVSGHLHNYRNINVFGLAFILTFCFLAMLIDIVLLKFLVYMRRFRKTFAPRIDAWIQDGVYQLQRRAFEAHGVGVWDRLDIEIPVTAEKTDLHNLPLESVPVSRCKCHNSALEPANSLGTTVTPTSFVADPDDAICPGTSSAASIDPTSASHSDGELGQTIGEQDTHPAASPMAIANNDSARASIHTSPPTSHQSLWLKQAGLSSQTRHESVHVSTPDLTIKQASSSPNLNLVSVAGNGTKGVDSKQQTA